MEGGGSRNCLGIIWSRVEVITFAVAMLLPGGVLRMVLSADESHSH